MDTSPTHGDDTRVPVLDLVIPVWNEAATLPGTLAAVTRVADTLGVPWRLTVVDNGSTDESAAIVTAAAQVSSTIRLLRVAKPGKGAALRTGILAATAPYVLYMDVDLSADLRHVREFLDSARQTNVDMIIGSRLHAQASVDRSFLRSLSSRLFNGGMRVLLGVPYKDTQCGFKLLRRETMQSIVVEVRESGWFFDAEVLLLAHKQGRVVQEVPIVWKEFAVQGRKSKLHVVRDGVRVCALFFRLYRRWGKG